VVDGRVSEHRQGSQRSPLATLPLPDVLGRLHESIRPGVLAQERTIPLLGCFDALLPSGLQRGSTVAVSGPATVSCAVALAVGSAQAGSWVMVIGVPSLGLAAAFEQGLPLDHLVLVGTPPPRLWPDVVVTAAEGAEVVIASVPDQMRASDVRRVQARLVRSGSVLVLLGSEGAVGLQPDVRIVTAHPRWDGIEMGAGRLLTRRIDVAVEGRRAVRPRRHTLVLPDATGRAAIVPQPAVVSHGADREHRGVPMVAASDSTIAPVLLRDVG
jgi:hypothetical protein